MFPYLGLILILLSWLGGIYLVTKWRGTNSMSLSLHAASNKTASILFAFALVSLGLAFYMWAMKWFAPHLNLSVTFIVLLTLTIACLCVAGLIADIQGWRHKVHYVAAYTMAYLYLPLSLLILFSHSIAPLAKVFGTICLTWMVVSLLLIWLVAGTRRHYLLFQSSYIIAFQLIVLSAAYIG